MAGTREAAAEERDGVQPRPYRGGGAERWAGLLAAILKHAGDMIHPPLSVGGGAVGRRRDRPSAATHPQIRHRPAAKAESRFKRIERPHSPHLFLRRPTLSANGLAV
jgi:hypothetical protein